MLWYQWFLLCWFGIGLLIIFVCGMLIVIKEESFQVFLGLLVFGPILIILAIIITVRDIFEDKKIQQRDQQNKQRKKARWWELKEFGGRF